MRFAGKAKSEKPGNQTGVKRKLGSDISSAKKPKGIPYNEVNGSSLLRVCVCACACVCVWSSSTTFYGIIVYHAVVKKAAEPVTKKEKRQMRRKQQKNYDTVIEALHGWERLRRCH